MDIKYIIISNFKIQTPLVRNVDKTLSPDIIKHIFQILPMLIHRNCVFIRVSE